jgi:hypothetical protein
MQGFLLGILIDAEGVKQRIDLGGIPCARGGANKVNGAGRWKQTCKTFAMQRRSEDPVRSFNVLHLGAIVYFCAALELYSHGPRPLTWLGYILEGLGFVLLAHTGRTHFATCAAPLRACRQLENSIKNTPVMQQGRLP